MKRCSVEGCPRPYNARGLCRAHLYHLRRYGVMPTHQLRTTMTVAERFVARTTPGENGCVLWTGGRTPAGYGTCRFRGRNWSAHAVAYVLFVGEFDTDQLEIDHLCRTPSCVNVAHLEPVTHRVNMLRSANARKTHCANGHEFTAENTRVNAKGHRQCRACVRDRSQRSRARKQAA